MVTLFASSGLQRDLKAGRITLAEDLPRTKSILFLLPHSAWTLGLLLGGGIAIVLVALTLVVFHLFSITEIPFKGFLVIKAGYTGLLGCVVARWVILRQLAPA